jgi:hypothetical protein
VIGFFVMPQQVRHDNLDCFAEFIPAEAGTRNDRKALTPRAGLILVVVLAQLVSDQAAHDSAAGGRRKLAGTAAEHGAKQPACHSTYHCTTGLAGRVVEAGAITQRDDNKGDSGNFAKFHKGLPLAKNG